MKFIIFVILAIFIGCSSPQHIRKSNYYDYDWSLANMVVSDSNYEDTFYNHPIFYKDKNFLGGKLKQEEALHYFLFGFFPKIKIINIDNVCENSSFEQAYIDHDFGQALISLFTLGIYTPRTARIWCNENI